ncbi:hypothetical protein L7F22_057701 [Adiantum nelumboides]|nr:hypothetical protein [Adiantum nelumboides]
MSAEASRTCDMASKGSKTPKTPMRMRLSFASALAAPSKLNQIEQLQAALNQVMEENWDLKACVSKLEARFDSIIDFADKNVKEVEATTVKAHSVTLAKVETCVKTELREQQLQEENALKVRIGNLPQAWESIKYDFSERINFLNETLKPIRFDYDMIECITSRGLDKHIPSGHAILEFGNKKVDAIVHWPHPTNLEELQIFLGLANFYHKFIRDYTKISIPMTNQLKAQCKTFTWGEEQQQIFEKLKVALASAPILVIVVETDASDRAIGAVLLQYGRSIAFESKKLDKAQQNYFVYERELYAIIHALKKWRHYLYGAQFEVVFDHESIKWFTQQTDLKGQKAR